MDSLMKSHNDFVNASKRYESAKRELAEAINEIEVSAQLLGEAKERFRIDLDLHYLSQKK